MYKQTIQNIKVAILPLDGIIFDLNKYRYNYYNHICKKKNVTLDKKEFYSHLSNMYDMYKDLPLSHSVDIGPLNAKIERELSQYLHLKGIKPKEGVLELIEYLHQKDIKIAVLSTHHTKNAVEYLQISNLYNKVHFIIGSDTSSLPLPSTQILETIQDFFKVESKEVLVISPFMTLNQAANQLHMNIIYCEDLLKAGQEEKETSYKTVSNSFEVLNTLLFDRYEEGQMYSSILGMDNITSEEELNNVYQNLVQKYDDDSQILDVINQTYEYHLSHFNEHTIKDASVSIQEDSHKTHQKLFSFDDETEDQPITNPIQEIKEEKPKESIIMHTLNDGEEKELAALLKQIQKKDKPQDVLFNEETFEEDFFNENHQEDDTRHPLLSVLSHIIYVLSISFIILFIGIIIAVAFIHQWNNPNTIFYIIQDLFQTYYEIVEYVFMSLFNSCHSLFSAFPSYEQYSQFNQYISMDGIKLLNIYIFNSIIIGVIKIIWYFIKRRQTDTDVKEDSIL